MFNCQESIFCCRTFYNDKAAYNYFVVYYTILVASGLFELSSRALHSFFFNLQVMDQPNHLQNTMLCFPRRPL